MLSIMMRRKVDDKPASLGAANKEKYAVSEKSV